jgi:hypothetical protein
MNSLPAFYYAFGEIKIQSEARTMAERTKGMAGTACAFAVGTLRALDTFFKLGLKSRRTIN